MPFFQAKNVEKEFYRQVALKFVNRYFEAHVLPKTNIKLRNVSSLNNSIITNVYFHLNHGDGFGKYSPVFDKLVFYNWGNVFYKNLYKDKN